jgi:hypothetical protein
MRWMNRIATATILLTIIAGPPLLAAAWLLHHPWQPPRPDQLRAWTNQPLTADTIIAGCIATAAGGWLLLVWQVTRRAHHHLTRGWRRLRRLPLPTPAQMTAGSMAGVAAFTFPHTDTAPADASPSPEATTDHHTDRQQPSPPGITLPGGGWMPYPTALAVTTAVALIWRQRRRHYRPDPARLGTHHDDPDLQPLPATADAITATLNTTPTPAPPTSAPLTDHLPAGVLHLEGPGAAAAARGLLVTTALAAITTPLTAGVRIRIGELRRILPDLDPRHPHLTDLVADDDTPQPPEPDSGDGTDREPATNRSHPPVPPPTIVVLTTTTAATTHWHVAADGTVTEHGTTGRRRLCILDQNAATDLLDLVHRTRTAPEHHPPDTTPHRTPPTAAKPKARLTLLGTCRLATADGPVKLRRTAGLQILAYLAVHPAGATRTELIRAIWPELPPATIGQRFHTTLADLRKQLRPLLDDDPVIRLDDRYHLNHNAISTDVHDLRHATRAAAENRPGTIQQSPPRTTPELAAGWTWPWLTAAREALHRDSLDTYASSVGQAPPPPHP